MRKMTWMTSLLVAVAAIGIYNVRQAQAAPEAGDAQLTEQFNDFKQWEPQQGDWKTTTDNWFRGTGGCVTRQKHALPAEFDLSFKFKLVQGSQLQITLEGTPYVIGNSSFWNVIGVAQPRGLRFSELKIENKRVYTLRLATADGRLNVFLDGQRFASLKWPAPKDSIHLLIGADQSPEGASTEFGQFVVATPGDVAMGSVRTTLDQLAVEARRVRASVLPAPGAKDPPTYSARMGGRLLEWFQHDIDSYADRPEQQKRVDSLLTLYAAMTTLPDLTWTPDQIEQASRQIMFDGTEDPCVLLAYIDIAQHSKSMWNSHVFHRDLMAAVDQPGVDPWLQAAARSLTARAFARSNDKAMASLSKAAADKLVPTLAEALHKYKGDELAEANILRMTAAARGDLLEVFDDAWTVNILADGGVSPYVSKVLAGHQQIELAWKARGSGYANTVTPEGWKGFAAHLADARKDLTAAYSLRPTDPHAASDMLYLSMGENADPVTEMRSWFLKAADADPDYSLPYNNWSWGLEPRWYGSFEEMLKTAKFWSDRYPNSVTAKAEALSTVAAVGKFSENYKKWWDDQTLFDLAESTTHAYVKLADPTHGRQALANLVHGAVTSHRYEEAAAAFKEIDQDNRSQILHDGGVDRPKQRILAAFAGPLGKDAMTALRAFENGKPDTTEKICAGMLTDPHADLDSTWFARNYTLASQLQQKLQANEWVDLNFDKDMTGWLIEAGKWKVESPTQAFVESTDGGAFLYPLIQPGENYELTGKIQMVSHRFTDARVSIWMNVGLRTEVRTFLTTGASQLFAPVQKTTASTTVKAEGFNSWRLVRHKTTFSFWVNDQPVFRDVDLSPAKNFHDPHDAWGPDMLIGAGPFAQGQEFRISDLRMRLLDPNAPPSHPPAPPR